MHQRHGYFFRTCANGRRDRQTTHTPENKLQEAGLHAMLASCQQFRPLPTRSAVCVPLSWSLNTGSCLLCSQPGWLPPSSEAAPGSPSPQSAQWCRGVPPHTCGRPARSGAGAGRCAPSRRTPARTPCWECRPCRPEEGGHGECGRWPPSPPAPRPGPGTAHLDVHVPVELRDGRARQPAPKVEPVAVLRHHVLHLGGQDGARQEGGDGGRSSSRQRDNRPAPEPPNQWQVQPARSL